MNIAWFNDILNKDVALVGGKGASLGEMYNARLPIPPGFCITSEAYIYFLDKARIKDKIEKLLKGLDTNNNDALQQASEQIKALIIKQEIPSDLKTEIIEAYDNLNVSHDVFKSNSKSALALIKAGRDLPYVAVRSSATAEDLPSISKDEHVLVKINNRTYFRNVEEIYDLVGDGTGFDIEIPAMYDNKIQWVKVGSLYKHKVKNGEKLYKIETETGREIIVSPNHALFILDEDDLKTKIVKSILDLKGNEKLPAINRLPLINLNEKEIKVLDYIECKNIIDEKGILKIKDSNNWRIQSGLPEKLKINKDLAYFLGVYCAEGSTYGNNEIIITNSNESIMKRIIVFASSLGLYNNQKLNKNSLRFYNKTLVRFLNEVAGTPDKNVRGKGKICRNKKVPEFIFSWNQTLIGEFLKGCFDGDGYCGKNSISYCSTSKMLTSGMIKLLEMLDIKWYMRKQKNAFNINIQPNSFERFSKLIGFESESKQERLGFIVKEFKEKERHYESFNKISISPKLSKYLRENIESHLQKTEILANFCPICDKKINKSSKYLMKERFYCNDCHKAFYEKGTIKKKIRRYVYYDSKGRFSKNQVPWNKGFLSKSLTIQQFKKISNKNNIYFDNLNDSIKWDSIKKIKELTYNNHVYDFCIPEVENFAAGIGGIITHNTASFAGQQETFLNIKGNTGLLEAVKKCWASLFTARAIYYRQKNNFDHMKVYLSVVVQKMVNSEKSGVMFTINPSTNNKDEIMIESGFGLGEAIVSGSINPNNYIVDKNKFTIKAKKITEQTWAFVRDEYQGKTIKRNLPKEKYNEQVMNDNEIINLAKYGQQIEEHYKKPMDIEFAIEGGKIYIVQARPITTIKKIDKVEESMKDTKLTGKIILKGLAASPGVASGKVKIVADIHELDKIQKGDIMVTKMTDPDFVPAMERASGIVTNEGGITSHAAIVSRELGVPCVVGTEKATEILKDNDVITVDGSAGQVYEGEVKIQYEQEKYEYIETITKVKTITDLPEFVNRAVNVNPDGIGLVRIEFMIVNGGIHPAKYIKDGRAEDYIQLLMTNLEKIATPFKGKPIWVRTSDIRTDEYRDLKGGEDEPHEDNPMIGLHGIRRALAQPEILKAEFEAIKRLHDKGYTNLGIMIPFLISLEELQKSKQILREVGLEPIKDIDFGVMIETPASVWIIEDLCKEGMTFISFGTNDLTQTTLGIDRNNEHIQNLYTELHPAVLRSIKYVIETCKKYKVQTSICGQAGSNPEMAEFLVNCGIDSVSVNVDAITKIRRTISQVEKKLLLDHVRNK